MSSPEDPIEFEVSYDVNQEIKTYIAFSLTEIDRGLWVYNDNSLDFLTAGKGRKNFRYSCSLSSLNDIKLKLQISVRDSSNTILAFAKGNNSPIILLNRTDISADDISAKDSATGLIQRNGHWETLVDE